MLTDLYKSLEIPPSSMPDKIKKAYRTAALKYHPDKTSDNKLLEEKFRQVRHAYEILSNEKQRRAYDLAYIDYYRRRQNRPAPADHSARKARMTPHAYLSALKQLKVKTDSLGRFGVQQYTLMADINKLLPDKVIQSLRAHDDLRFNREVINLALQCSAKLNRKNSAAIKAKLIRLAGTDNESLQLIYRYTESDLKVYFEKIKSSIIHTAVNVLNPFKKYFFRLQRTGAI